MTDFHIHHHFSNARRHLANGDKHLAEGRPEHARGSYAKAVKNYLRALEADALFKGDFERVSKIAEWARMHKVVPIGITKEKAS